LDAEALEVLLDAVLDDLGAVSNVAQVETGAPRSSVCRRVAQSVWRKAFERSSPAPEPVRLTPGWPSSSSEVVGYHT
jgi:hypothetical protein